jgi:MFS family permease
MPSLWSADPSDSAVRRGIRISLIEGAVVGAMFAAMETWLVPLLVQRLGAAAAYVGWLTIVPQLGVAMLGPIVRPLIDRLGGNRRTVLICSSAQIVFTAALAVSALFAGHDWSASLALWLAIANGLVGAVNGPAWTAWMGDLVPRTIMGRYLSWRWRIFIGTRLAFGLIFAQVLAQWPATKGPWGLFAVFCVATASRAASVMLLARQPVFAPRPPIRGADSNRGAPGAITFLDFLRSIHRTPLGRWALVWSSLVFGLFVCGPYVAPYLIAPLTQGGLELDPRSYWLLINVGVVTRFVVLAPIGRLIDLAGAASVLRIGVIGLALFPVIWSYTTSLRWLAVTEVLVGIAACAAELSIGVLLFSCNRDPRQRVRLIGFQQAVAAVAVITGTYAGKQLLELLQATDWAAHLGWAGIDGSPFRLLILISVVARLPAVVMALALLPRLRDLDDEETAGLWRLVPGTGVAESIRRGLMGVFRRPEG